MFRFRKKNTDIYNFSNTNTRDGILPFPLRIFYIQMTSKIHIFYAEYNVSQNMQESTMICLRKKSGEFKASFSSKERKNKEIKKKVLLLTHSTNPQTPANMDTLQIFLGGMCMSPGNIEAHCQNKYQKIGLRVSFKILD